MAEREIRKRLKAPRDGRRLDRFLAAEFPHLSRSCIQRAIASGRVLVQGIQSRASHRLKEGETIDVRLETAAPDGGLHPTPDIPVQALYRDDHLMVINKPAGLVCHPGAGTRDGTLADALAFQAPEHLGRPWFERGGLVHRIDRDTSGLVIAARNEAAFEALSRQVKSHSIRRTYLALAWGRPRETSGEISSPLGRNPRNRKKMAVVRRGGRSARTFYRVLTSYDCASLLEIGLDTGRTHQIRVHLQSISNPVVGDPRYGGRGRMADNFRGDARISAGGLLQIMNRQALHAWKLSFRHPVDGRPIEVRSVLPADMKQALSLLAKRSQQPDVVPDASAKAGAGRPTS